MDKQLDQYVGSVVGGLMREAAFHKSQAEAAQHDATHFKAQAEALRMRVEELMVEVETMKSASQFYGSDPHPAEIPAPANIAEDRGPLNAAIEAAL